MRLARARCITLSRAWNSTEHQRDVWRTGWWRLKEELCKETHRRGNVPARPRVRTRWKCGDRHWTAIIRVLPRRRRGLAKRVRERLEDGLESPAQRRRRRVAVRRR